jgi:hypothetical protein
MRIDSVGSLPSFSWQRRKLKAFVECKSRLEGAKSTRRKCSGALVLWAKQLGRPRVGWLGAINWSCSFASVVAVQDQLRLPATFVVRRFCASLAFNLSPRSIVLDIMYPSSPLHAAPRSAACGPPASRVVPSPESTHVEAGPSVHRVMLIVQSG